MGYPSVVPADSGKYGITTEGEGRVLMNFSSDKISALQTGVICEMWDRFAGPVHGRTGSATRKYHEAFTKKEREKARRLFHSHIWKWNMTTGIPFKGVYMKISTYLFIKRLANFCYEI